MYLFIYLFILCYYVALSVAGYFTLSEPSPHVVMLAHCLFPSTSFCTVVTVIQNDIILLHLSIGYITSMLPVSDETQSTKDLLTCNAVSTAFKCLCNLNQIFLIGKQAQGTINSLCLK